MDFTAATLNSLASQRDNNTTKSYPSFAAPAPLNLSHTPYGSLNTLPSPLQLDFPSITSPGGPYAFYRMNSPATTRDMQPTYDADYLKRLKRNPMFRDLQSLLVQECLQMQVPASLITTSWNLMHIPKTIAKEPTEISDMGSGQEVYMQHMKLQDKLLKVRIDPAISADGLSVENEYSTEVGHIEMGRYRALHSCPDEKVKVNINAYYDKERVQLVKNKEAKLDILIQKADGFRNAVQQANKDNAALTRRPQSPFTQGASLLLQPVDESKISAVRHLKFNTSDDKNHKDDDDDNDYLNGSVNSEDFEIDEIDVETIDCEDNDTMETHTDNTVNHHSEHVLSLSHIKDPITEKDLLQQCLSESGISATPDKLKDASTVTNAVYPETASNWITQPDSSTSESPDSISYRDILNSDSDSNSDHLSSTKFQTFQPSYKLNFTQPKNISVALNEIQKLCSGPTVSFTPELRRDVTINCTPDSQKVSPLGEICANTSGKLSNSSRENPSNRSWISLATQNLNNSRNECFPSNSRKRKSCDVVIDIPEDESVKEQADSVTNFDNNANYQTPVLKTHRMLNSEATNILTNWYQTHVHYPYPSDEEVEHLAKLTNITTRQVKKWMANKRVRCFNTLSITGNQHPIKNKYQGTGRRKRAFKTPANETASKENCDSTTNDNKTYSALNESARIILNEWFEAHFNNPYPTEEEKQQLATMCGISLGQVKSWFANKRNRTNNTRKQVPNYFLSKFPEYTHMVNFLGQKREEARVSKRRKVNEIMYIQPTFYL